MKFRIIIDKEKEEEIIARVHKKTHLIDEIEAFYIEDGKTYASYADQKKYLVKMHLYELEAILPNHLNITLRRSRLSGVARATNPDKQSHLVTNYCTMF